MSAPSCQTAAKIQIFVEGFAEISTKQEYSRANKIK